MEITIEPFVSDEDRGQVIQISEGDDMILGRVYESNPTWFYFMEFNERSITEVEVVHPLFSLASDYLKSQGFEIFRVFLDYYNCSTNSAFYSRGDFRPYPYIPDLDIYRTPDQMSYLFRLYDEDAAASQSLLLSEMLDPELQSLGYDLSKIRDEKNLELSLQSLYGENNSFSQPRVLIADAHGDLALAIEQVSISRDVLKLRLIHLELMAEWEESNEVFKRMLEIFAARSGVWAFEISVAQQDERLRQFLLDLGGHYLRDELSLKSGLHLEHQISIYSFKLQAKTLEQDIIDAARVRADLPEIILRARGKWQVGERALAEKVLELARRGLIQLLKEEVENDVFVLNKVAAPDALVAPYATDRLLDHDNAFYLGLADEQVQ